MVAKLFIKAIVAYITKPKAREGIKADLQYLLDNTECTLIFIDSNGKEIRV